MIKKRLSKTIWYGADVDTDGNPVIPGIAENSDDLTGLHHGELYLHESDDEMSLWARSLGNKVLRIGGSGEKGELLWELRQTDNGEKYIWSAYNVVTQQGITMYADGTFRNLPSIYEGLPIDMDTIYWEETTDENGNKVKILKSKGGEGNGTFGEIEITGEGNAITKVDVVKGDEETPDKLVFSKEKTFIDKEYLEENYYTKTKTDELFFKKDDAKGLFVTLDETEQEILGLKTFKNGLNIGTSRIWQSQDDVVYIDANLAVRGAVTFFAVDGVKIPTIMESLNLDPETLELDAQGRLTVIGGGGGSIEHPLSWSGFSSGSYDGSEAKSIYIPSKVSELTNDALYAKTSDLAKYLPLTGGTLTGDLRLKDDTNYGRTIYFGDGSYAYITENSDDHLNIYASNGVSINGYTAIHAGNYTDYFDTSDYITDIVNKSATEAGSTFDRYLSITKGGVDSDLTVGYATHSRLLKAYGVSNLSDNSSWNTYVGLKCGYFSASASDTPTTPGSNANSIITHMPTYNYGVQIAHICELSGGLYPSGVHLFARTLVNGSYKSWRRIITNGSTMTFEVYASIPYINLTNNSVTYKIQANSGLYLGISTSNGIKIDSSGNLLATGSMTFQSTSDKRLKENIRNFNACEELMALGGVYKFEYKDNEVKRNPTYKGTHIGLIYQNVKGTSLERMCMEREDGFGSLNYIDTSFISLLAGVGMEHETRIQRLERENKELRMEVEQLKRM